MGMRVGFVPSRAGRLLVENTPNPTRETFSPLARAPRMASISVFTSFLRLGPRQGGPVCDVRCDIRFPHFAFLPELNRM